MKKKILTLILIVVAINVFGQIPTNLPTNGLVGYWPFNGNANDESGNGNNGIVTGAVLTSDKNNNLNKAYIFSGNNQYITINDNDKLDLTGDFTVSTWINATSLASYNMILTKHESGVSGAGTYTCGVWNDGGNYKTVFQATPDFSSSSYPSIFGAIKINQWYNFIVVYSKQLGELKYYLNGALVFTKIQNYTILNNNYNLIIGAEKNSINYQNFWNGKIDDIGIWNRKLTDSEIASLNNCNNQITSNNASNVSKSICQGDSYLMSENNNANYTYEWYKNYGLISGATTNTYSINQAGTYIVKISDGINCSVISSPSIITVNPLPSVSLASVTSLIHSKANPVTLVGNPSGGVYSGPGVSGNILTPLNAGLGLKKVTYSYTNLNNCTNSATRNTVIYDTVTCSTFDTLFINVQIAGFSSSNNISTIKIWPNPANDHIIIDNGNIALLSGYKVKIESILGQEVFKSSINQQQFSVDLSTWNGKGIYLVHIIDNQDNIVVTKKIVLQ
jgi:hypothetical protein